MSAEKLECLVPSPDQQMQTRLTKTLCRVNITPDKQRRVYVVTVCMLPCGCWHSAQHTPLCCPKELVSKLPFFFFKQINT